MTHYSNNSSKLAACFVLALLTGQSAFSLDSTSDLATSGSDTYQVQEVAGSGGNFAIGELRVTTASNLDSGCWPAVGGTYAVTSQEELRDLYELYQSQGIKFTDAAGTPISTYSYGYSDTWYGMSLEVIKIPDLRGEFLRGADQGRGVDSGRGIGTWQDEATKDYYALFDANVTQDFYMATQTGVSFTANRYAFDGRGDGYSSGSWTRSNGIQVDILNDNNTHPRNVSVVYCVQYQ